MLRQLLVVIPLLAPFIQACSRTSPYSDNLESLIATERAFASTSVSSGTRAAFLEFLSDRGIVLDPTPTNGKELWLERSESESRLFWQPVFADVSIGGDLGYTTGPWEWSAHRDTTPSLFGHYVTVWKRNADHMWKIAIDGGIYHDQFPDADSSVGSPDHRNQSGYQQLDHIDTDSAHAELLEFDRAYSLIAGDSGVASALTSFASSDARICRDGVFPVVGRNEGIAVISGSGYNNVTWESMDAVVSERGDLGFTYGIATVSFDNNEEHFANYLHIWKRLPDAGWKVVLDLLTPSPPVAPVGSTEQP